MGSRPVLSDAECCVWAWGLGLFSSKLHALSPNMNDCRVRLDRPTEPPLWVFGRAAHADVDVGEECYLVDPASSHMLVSKIKPCMCKYELIQTVKLRMAH